MAFWAKVPRGCIVVIETHRNILIDKLYHYTVKTANERYDIARESRCGHAGVYLLHPGERVELLRDGLFFTSTLHAVINVNGIPKIKREMRVFRPGLRRPMSRPTGKLNSA